MLWSFILSCSRWFGRLPLHFGASAELGPFLLTPLVIFPLSLASLFFSLISGLGLSRSMGLTGFSSSFLRLPPRTALCGSPAPALFEICAHTWFGLSLLFAGFATPSRLPALGALRVWTSPFHLLLEGGSRSGCSTLPSCRLSPRPSFYVSPPEFIFA